MSLRVKQLLAQDTATSGLLPGALPSLRDLFPAQTGKPDQHGPIVGIFVSSGDAGVAEICAGAGFDYLLIDGEHSPLSLESIQSQLRAIAGYPVLSVVRVPHNDPVLIKQYLDLGVQTLIVPMVDTPDQARAAASAVAYPPDGVRGLGSALARSGRWSRIPDYLARARHTLTLLVQIESHTAVNHAAEILATDGVDGVFIGPSDLSASMGLLGRQTHPDVVAAVKHVMAEANAVGKIVGVNAFHADQARDYVAAGADFVNVSADVAILARGTEKLVAEWGIEQEAP
ncbi:HpcH/HpaI aldolase family protein [Auritidibacter ignavus]|uniref:HpcH/HpaI aldolase family protein n=1 Tax=Auritidibacter ignavus TaxID=678932 RepID=UPI0024BB0017|nr:HpcH/HpaI aldolase/citrate lyase family protein [Auritidibacter ignavus]WHS35794.1 HpcH/HpaI aldolase/citrate lyase family protein [Auritidibacter ignavus]